MNFAEGLLRLSFYRTNDIPNGISLRSQTLTSTFGRVQRSGDFYKELIICEGDPKLVVNNFNSIAILKSINKEIKKFQASKLIDINMNDLGLTMTGEAHPFDVVSHLKLLANMNPTINVL